MIGRATMRVIGRPVIEPSPAMRRTTLLAGFVKLRLAVVAEPALEGGENRGPSVLSRTAMMKEKPNFPV